MKTEAFIKKILPKKANTPVTKSATAFAPSNIALVKYWGKRNVELNLPNTPSLSISLGNYGATTTISLAEKDNVTLNGEPVNPDSDFFQRAIDYVDLFRKDDTPVLIATQSNIPIAAGLASSACGFSSLILCLNDFYGWNLDQKELSMLARIGSGSATRSLWQGFVEWHASDDPLESFAEPIETNWPDFRVGLLIINKNKKFISSRKAMQHTTKTSPLYKKWPDTVTRDLARVKKAITDQDFEALGSAAEENAEAMHATMALATPSIHYSQPETDRAKKTIKQLRKDGVDAYYTQDAGPNLKILFLKKDEKKIISLFPDLLVVKPFEKNNDVMPGILTAKSTDTGAGKSTNAG